MQTDLQPMVGPDQPVELRVSTTEGKRVRLPFHEVHVLRVCAQRGPASREIVLEQSAHLAVLSLRGQSLVSPYVVNLAVQYVRPLEQLLRFGNEPGVFDLDHRLLEWKSRRTHEETLRDEIVLLLLELDVGAIGSVSSVS